MRPQDVARRAVGGLPVENGIARRSAADGDNVWTRRRWLQLPALGAAAWASPCSSGRHCHWGGGGTGVVRFIERRTNELLGPPGAWLQGVDQWAF